MKKKVSFIQLGMFAKVQIKMFSVQLKNFFIH